MLDDGLVIRRDTDGLADPWFRAKLASFGLLVAAAVVLLLKVNAVVVLVLLGLAVLPALVYAVLSVVAVVAGLGSLTTRRGRRSAKAQFTDVRGFIDARTVRQSLEAQPEHLAVIPAADVIDVEQLTRRALVLHTQRGPQQLAARWWHPLVLGELRRALTKRPSG